MAAGYRIGSRCGVWWRLPGRGCRASGESEANVAVSVVVSRWAVVVTASALVVGTGACQPAAEARSAENTESVEEQAAGASASLRAGPNVVGINCDGGACKASCMAGSSILLAYGFHGRAYDANVQVSSGVCGQGVEWLGACIGQESCEVSTPCTSSAMYLICR